MKRKIFTVMSAAAMLAAAVFIATTGVDSARAQGKGGKGGGGKGVAPPKIEPTPIPPDPALDNAQIHLLKVQGNIYMVAGPGANSALSVGKNGALIVDTM